MCGLLELSMKLNRMVPLPTKAVCWGICTLYQSVGGFSLTTILVRGHSNNGTIGRRMRGLNKVSLEHFKTLF